MTVMRATTLQPLCHSALATTMSRSSLLRIAQPHTRRSLSLWSDLRQRHSERMQRIKQQKAKRNDNLSHEWGEMRGEMSYLVTLARSKDLEKHEAQIQLVKPMAQKVAPRLPAVTMRMLSGGDVLLPEQLLHSDTTASPAISADNIIVDSTKHTAAHPVTTDAKQQIIAALNNNAGGISKHKLTVLSLFMTDYSRKLGEQWRQAWEASATAEQQASVQWMQLSILDRWMYRTLLSGSVLRTLRQHLPESQHHLTGVTLQDPSSFIVDVNALRPILYGQHYLEGDNAGFMSARARMFGQTLVIDSEGAVRWMTIGRPAAADRELGVEQRAYFVHIMQQLVSANQMKQLSRVQRKQLGG